MTLVSSGAIFIGGTTSTRSIELELSQSGSAAAHLGDTAFRNLAGKPSGAIYLSDFYGKSSVIHGNVTLTSSQTYTLPATAGTSITAVSISGGGGGGGGSAREDRGTYSGGGGGGSGEVRQATFTVTVGQALTVVVGAGGSAGGGRDGPYSGGITAGYGGDSYVQRSGVNVVYAYGGAPGTVSQPGATSPGGVAGGNRATGIGTQINPGYAGAQGEYEQYNATTPTASGTEPVRTPNFTGYIGGGIGGSGMNTAGTPAGGGAGGRGNQAVDVANRAAATPGGYGAGGSGGGCNLSSNPYINGSAGTQGVVFLSW